MRSRDSPVPVRGPDDEYLGRFFVYVDATAQRELDRQRIDFLTAAASSTGRRRER